MNRLLLCIIVGLVSLMVPEPATLDVKSSLQGINQLNAKIAANLDWNDYKEENNLYTCYKYKGDRSIEEELDHLYVKPYEGAIMKEEDTLYVCLPRYCSHITMTDTYEILEEEKDYAMVEIQQKDSSSTFRMEKENNEWKFVFPVLPCS